MTIDIAGEDAVTREIVKRLIADYRPDITIGTEHPVRGHQIRAHAANFNRLGLPVFLLADEDDAGCPPALIRDWLADVPLSNTMLFRVARTEGEVWLMADRTGFSKWLRIRSSLIPLPQAVDGDENVMELPFKLKPSQFLILNLVPNSASKEIKEALTPRYRAKKGPGYNSAIVPFIQKQWNPETARQASNSLDRTINRLLAFQP